MNMLDITRPGSVAPALFTGRHGAAEVSFEFFPPRGEAAQESVRQAMRSLAALEPRFFSVTYGAGGTTQAATHETAAWIARETRVPAAAHLTCVGASRAEVDRVAEALWQAGVRRIVALRGDPPAGTGRFTAHPNGYADAAALVAGLRRIAPFDISVGAYPEVHPEAASAQADLDQLKRKLDAGATRALTQFFFEPETFLRFRDRAVAAGIDAALVPGIMPVSNIAQTRRFAALCGAAVPAWLERLHAGLEEQADARQIVGAAVAAELCGRLLAEGVRQFHFYTLNRAELALGICHLLGLRAGVALEAAA